MPDFERLTDALRVLAAPDAATKAWARGYASGKTRARLEVLAVSVVLYFGLALIGRYFGAA